MASVLAVGNCPPHHSPLVGYLPIWPGPKLGLAQCLPLPSAKAVLEQCLWAGPGSGLPWSRTVALPPGPVMPCTYSTRTSENICLLSAINKGLFGSKSVINVNSGGGGRFKKSSLKLQYTFWLPSCDTVLVCLKKKQQGLGIKHSTEGCVTSLLRGRGSSAL